MLALLLLVLQGVAAPQVEVSGTPRQLPSGYETQLIRSASGKTTLSYSASPRSGDPVLLSVSVSGAAGPLWQRTSEVPFDLASVDDRGQVAALVWEHRASSLTDSRGRHPMMVGLHEARGAGVLRLYDVHGALAAERALFRDRGDSCLTQATLAFDLMFVGESTMLLRANEFADGTGTQFTECWSVFDSRDLATVAQWAPARVLGRAPAPLWLPLEWGSEDELALDVRTLPGLAVLIVRWPFPNWRAVEGGVELQEDFTVLDLAGRKLAELSHSASERRAEPDPLFNLALPRCRTWRRDEWFRAGSDGRFALVRGLDGAWINYRVVGDADLRRVERAP